VWILRNVGLTSLS